MVLSIRNLLSYAWKNLVAALGTTTLSILLFSFAIPLIIFGVTLAVGWREERKAGKTVKDIIKGSILSWQTIIPSTIYLLAWIGLLGWSLSNTAHKDHVALLGRIRTLASDNKSLRSSNDQLKNENQQLKEKTPKVIIRTSPRPKPSEMHITDEQMKKVKELLRDKYNNQRARIFYVERNVPNDPSATFSIKLATALKDAGINAFPSGGMWFGAPLPSGISARVGKNQLALANAIADSLIQAGVINSDCGVPLIAGSNDEWVDIDVNLVP